MEKEYITAVCLGIGLAASSGFRVFVPLLVASIAGKLGFLPLSEGFNWLASWPAIVSFSAATFAEIGAYYIPFVDNLLDNIAIPMAVGGGTLLSASVFPFENDFLKWILSIILGGGSAALIQGGTTLSRLASSKLTAGIGNPVVSTGENVAAFVTPVLSMIFPLIIAVVIIIILSVIFLSKIFCPK
jgi:hypothetical protein